jgi:arginase
MSKGQPYKGVESAGSVLLDRFNLANKLYDSREFDRVTVHDCLEPEKTLVDSIIENTSDDSDMVLTIGGDHLTSFYSIAAQMIRAGPGNMGVIWLDAHTDINDQETSETKNKHGMVVSGLMGFQEFWGEKVSPEYSLTPNDIVYVGTRSIDPPEQEIIDNLGIRNYTADDVKRMGIQNVMFKILYEDLVDKPLLHLSYDVDVMDPIIFPCTGTKVGGGLTYKQVLDVMISMRQDTRFWSMDLVEFNPDFGISDHYVHMCGGICSDMVMTAFTE